MRRLVMLCLGGVLVLTAPPAVLAVGNTLYVTKSGNDLGNATCAAATPCATVAQAVANAFPSDTIKIGKGKFIETATISIDKDLTIEGSGIFGTRVASTAPWGGGQIFAIAVNAKARIVSLQIQNGAADLGGGIRNHGSLEVEDVWIRGSKANEGGGIYNDGFLVLRRVEIALNTGGGLLNAPSGTAIVHDTRIAANDGAGVANQSGVLFMRDSVIVGNQSPVFKGARHGSAGVLSHGGALALINVTVSGNQGVGVHTIYGATANLTHVTIANNTFGLIADQNADVSLRNTIIGENTMTDCLTGGASVAGVGSLVAATCLNQWPSPDNIIDTPAKIAPLAPNGWYNWTHGLLPGSPAMDAGNAEHCEPTDQRHVVRPLDGNGDGVAACDIGAYEYIAPGPQRGWKDRRGQR